MMMGMGCEGGEAVAASDRVDWGFRFQGLGLGFRVWGFGFRVWGLGF